MPQWPWAEDMYEPYLDSYRAPTEASTNDFRSLKENVFWVGCFQGEALEHLRVEAQGDVAVQASPEFGGQVVLNVYNFWQFPDLSWGNDTGPKLATDWVLSVTSDRLPLEQMVSLRLADAKPAINPADP
jgi:hypothetical protein